MRLQHALSNISKGQREAYRASFTQLRLYPDAPTVDLDYPLDYGQTCPRSFAFLIHFIEKLEDFVVLAGVYANSIITDKKDSILSIDPLSESLFLDLPATPWTMLFSIRLTRTSIILIRST